MNHAELVGEITGLADGVAGLLWHACLDSRRCQGSPGFPDLLFAGQAGVLGLEVKTEYAETAPEQDLWGWMLDGRPARYRVVRPGDVDTVVIAELARLVGS